MNTYFAVDPMALVLSEKAYLIYVELKHPHVAAVDTVRQVMQRVSAEERRVAVAQAKSMVDYGHAVMEASAA